MKKVLVLILFVVGSYGLTAKQLSNFKFSYTYGAKYQLGWTLAAISYKESSLGLHSINLADPSASQYHILLKSALKRHHIKDTSWNRSRMMEKLLYDRRFAAKEAIAELLYWKAYWIQKGYIGKWLWIKMVGSYNGGYYSNINYARKVARAIKILRKYK